MGASAALAATCGCSVSQPREQIVPYVRSPEYGTPGEPLFYATAIALGGYGTGVLVESHTGRPTRIEGNPDHPASLGGLDAISQASIFSLYDPDRSQAIMLRGEIRTWDMLTAAMESVLEEQRSREGAGIRILTETVTSPTLAAQLDRLLTKFSRAKWHQYEAVNQDNLLAGAEQAFGRAVETRYRFDRADVVLSLDADFLTLGPGHVRYARDFLSRRRLPASRGEGHDSALNRLYVVESGLTSTGTVADHRLPLPSGRIGLAARYLTEAICVRDAPRGGYGLSKDERRWLDVAAADLLTGKGLVVAGLWQPPAVHALVHRINEALGSVGEVIERTEPVPARPMRQVESLRELVEDARSGQVDLLLIAGGNPTYDSPADIPFVDALSMVGLSVRLGLYEDETSLHCHWHVPAAHELESWSDTRAFDGTASIVQPLIEPLYDGKTVHELVSVLLGEPGRTSHEIVREFWKTQRGEEGFERFWRRALHDGVVGDSRFAPIGISPIQVSLTDPSALRLREGTKPSFELALRPDPSIYDGRFANNAWLQELPKPITKLTWDNAALMSPQTAEMLNVRNEQLIEIRDQDRQVVIPAWVVPGHAEGAVTVHLGYGRSRAGSTGSHTGFSVVSFRHSDSLWLASPVTVRALASHYPLACTQQHQRMEGRDLVRLATWRKFQDQPDFAADNTHDGKASLYPHAPFRREGHEHAWGMSINLNTCTGCNACVIACQAENNIVSVGKDQVRRGREMHWMRVDHYYLVGSGNAPSGVHQPVTCMHCENAPCEVVCPVAATVHSVEGLNEMVYNRCVGTRYCSNNCPYKVRRFNFLDYSGDETAVSKLIRNPDVTVRTRGVMEKCTYCVQRINAARIHAKKEDRSIRDGEIVTACQSACPTQAIVFGDTADPESRVSALKSHPLDYGLLTELNTRPRTTYLARVTHPNPTLVKEEDQRV
jgi:molybdopterin-containing oxidoreductase family iron-sulfur binding subunit